MGKVEAVAAALAQIQAGQVQVMQEGLESVYDQAILDDKGQSGTLTQADLDMAVQKARDEDAQVLADAKAADDAALKAAQDAGVAALADLQVKLDALAAKEGQEAGVIASLKSSVDGLQKALSDISAILVPQPAPEVVP